MEKRTFYILDVFAEEKGGEIDVSVDGKVVGIEKKGESK